MLLSGCGTGMRSSARGIYPATKRNCLWSRQVLSDPSILGTILLVVDFPLSVVTDTLLLPRDVMKKEYPLEHPGADQQATKHADKVPAKVKPPPSTSKDAPQ